MSIPIRRERWSCLQTAKFNWAGLDLLYTAERGREMVYFIKQSAKTGRLHTPKLVTGVTDDAAGGRDTI